MKSIKTKLMSVVVAGSIVLPMITVHAAGLGDGLAKEQKQLLNQETRQQIHQIRQTISNNEKTNHDLLTENQGVRQSIRGVIQQIKQSKKVVPAADLSSIENQIQVVKQDVANLEATKSNMQSDRSAAKNDVQSKNLQDLMTQLNNIISVQGTRTTDLQKINQDLNTLLKTVQTAQADSTASTSASN